MFKPSFSIPVFISLCLAVVLFPFSAKAETEDDIARDVATFPQYVDWPKEAFGNAFANFTFAVIGDELLSKKLNASQKGKWLDGHPVSVENFGECDATSFKKLRACQVVFISVSQKGHLGVILKALKGKPVLTVSDMEDFTHGKGMIQLEPTQGRILIQINPGPVEKSKLKIRSQLMRIAKIEKGGE